MTTKDPAKRTDWDLLESWREGSSAAGSELLERYGRPIARFFANKVVSREDVADLSSQTFLACVKQRDKIRDPNAFKSYLFGVAINCLRVYIGTKMKRAREATDFAEVCVQQVDPTSMTSLIVRRREEMLVLQALRELPIEQQIVLELNLLEGLAGPRISEIVNIPEGTVRSRLRLGLARLQARVAELAASPGAQPATLSDLSAWARKIRRAIDGEAD